MTKTSHKEKIRVIVTKNIGKLVQAKKAKEKEAAQQTRRSTRQSIMAANRYEFKTFIDGDPSYTWAEHKHAGGRHSHGILGPGAYLSKRSDSNRNLPRAIAKARDAYPGVSFVCGHLLNAELGGDGKNPKNVTILTSTANSAHKKFDNPLKEAVGSLLEAYKELMKIGIDPAGLMYGIKVDVQTRSDFWGDTYPDTCISTGLDCTAEVVDQPDLDELIAALDRKLSPEQEKSRQKAETLMALVVAKVNQATANGSVDNDPPG